jgi:hypothetical protein
MQTDMISLYKKCLEIGAKLDLLTPFPQDSSRANWTTGKRDKYIAWCRWLIQFAKENRLICVHWGMTGAGTVMVQDATSANAAPTSTMMQSDKIHTTLAGAYCPAKEYARIYNGIYPGGYHGATGRTVVDGGLFTNPTFTGSGGASSPGSGTINGTIPTSVTVAIVTGSGTATCSQVARTIADDGDNAGNWFRVSYVPNAANDVVTIELQNIYASLSNGDTVRLEGLVRLQSGNDNCKGLEFFVNSQTATTGNLLCTDLQAATALQAAHPENFTIVMGVDAPVRTPQSTHGSPSSFKPTIKFTSVAATTPIVVDIACWNAEKLTASTIS